MAAFADTAQAQFAGSIALSSNEMFRGESISDDDPALSVSVSMDDTSGLFAGAIVSMAAGGEPPRVTYASQYAGYAIRTGETSVEAGIIHRSYDRIVDTDYGKDFVELYAGVTHKAVKARLYISPDYRRDNRTSFYGEINARLFSAHGWGVDGHFGLSVIPDVKENSSGSTLRTYRDWRLQVSRPIGKIFLSAGAAATNYPVYSASGKARLFGTISYAF